MFSTRNLSFTNAVWLGNIKSGRIGFRRDTNSLEITLYTMLRQEIGLKSVILLAPENFGMKERMVAFAAAGKKEEVENC